MTASAAAVRGKERAHPSEQLRAHIDRLRLRRWTQSSCRACALDPAAQVAASRELRRRFPAA